MLIDHFRDIPDQNNTGLGERGL